MLFAVTATYVRGRIIVAILIVSNTTAALAGTVNTHWILFIPITNQL